ncbi:MAG: hypothetical protein WBA74_02935, partial [Cyclobacteriaceae bacterium]
MIILLSKEFDASTDQVIDWLMSHDSRFVRLKSSNLTTDNCPLLIEGNQSVLHINNESIRSTDKLTIWYRNLDSPGSFFTGPEETNDEINKYLHDEYTVALQLLFSSWEEKRWLCHYHSLSFTKMAALQTAGSVGFTIPDTIVCNRKSDLTRFLAKYPKGIIT